MSVASTQPDLEDLNVIVSGQGEFLARRALEAHGFAGEVRSLAEVLTRDASRCATAYAVAILAGEACR
jgi:uncharacterized hydantoinase/oxoprolinase family protein